jgi:phosphonate transport system substrate-binding protein
MRFVTLLVVILSILNAKDTLYFGVVSAIRPEMVKRQFQPFIDYLSEKLNRKVQFATGLDYDDTIDKFVDGTFDMGYIGASPYVLATRIDRDAIRLIAGVETNNKPFFYAVIVTRRDSNIRDLKDLVGKRFAFGSERATLSFYLPFYMLEKEKIIDKLEYYDILGRDDIVAKNVIMGNYDAGGIRESVAKKYKKYLKRVVTSQPIFGSAIVVHRSMESNLTKKIEKILFELKDKEILNSIREGMSGFGLRKDSDYDELRKIMNRVEFDTSFDR